MGRRIALIGQQLIHTYPYLAYLNGSTAQKIAAHAKPWMKAFLLEQDLSPQTDELRVTRIWSPDAEEVGRLVETFGIEQVCDSPEQAIDGADGAMVLDEVLDSRTPLTELCLRAGVPVFVDKVLAGSAERTAALIALAAQKDVRIGAWSQLYFHPDLPQVRGAGPGGVGFINMRMAMDILPKYGIHPVSILQGAFAGRMVRYWPQPSGSGRAGMIEYHDGTRVFLYVGEDVPADWRLYYLTQDEEIIINRQDHGACFRRAAKALAAFLTGVAQIDAPDTERMNEASRLVECLTHSDGMTGPVTLDQQGQYHHADE